MEFIMVVIICFSMDCNAIWEQTRYLTMDNCLKASSNVKSFLMNKYPESAGEIYCMTELQFNEYYNYLKNGGKPTMESLQKPSAT